jgi:K+-sensing histidine kinase KdpD
MAIALVGFRKQAMESRQPVVVNERMIERAIESGHLTVKYVGDPPKSAVWVPLVAGGKATGVVSLQNLDRENAFGTSQVRLLSTLAGSLAVALESARLFEETRRLLAETNERAAELAIITSVQQGLAAKLDMQSMYDLVGDKIQQIFDTQGVDIAVLDEADGLIHFAYEIEKGDRLHSDPMPLIGLSGTDSADTPSHSIIPK